MIHQLTQNLTLLLQPFFVKTSGIDVPVAYDCYKW